MQMKLIDGKKMQKTLKAELDEALMHVGELAEGLELAESEVTPLPGCRCFTVFTSLLLPGCRCFTVAASLFSPHCRCFAASLSHRHSLTAQLCAR